jgi:hypothetical protein
LRKDMVVARASCGRIFSQPADDLWSRPLLQLPGLRRWFRRRPIEDGKSGAAVGVVRRWLPSLRRHLDGRSK